MVDRFNIKPGIKENVISAMSTNPFFLNKFSNNSKKRVVSIDDAKKVASDQHIDLIKVTGERGFIGAVAGIGYAEEQEAAVKL